MSDSTSVSSVVTHAGSLTTSTSPTSRTGEDYLDDVLSIPSVQSTSRPKSVNSEARCITNDSFVQEMEEKEEQKKRKEAEIIAKREERARKKKEIELKKIERKLEREKRKRESRRAGKGTVLK